MLIVNQPFIHNGKSYQEGHQIVDAAEIKAISSSEGAFYVTRVADTVTEPLKDAKK